MSENVSTSVRAEAGKCVDLPASMKAAKLAVIYLFFRQWTGTVTMSRNDFEVGADGSLPPEDITASLGQKKLVDPRHLRVFATLKKRAETLLDEQGLPFCKGMAVPLDRAKEIVEALRQIAEEYNHERDLFVGALPKLSQEWLASHPEFANRLPSPSPELVAGKIDADFAVTQFTPCELDATGSLNRKVEGLFEAAIADIAKKSRDLLMRSLNGKTAEDLSQKTLNRIKTIKAKLEGLRFINSGVNPLIEMLNRLLGLMPTKGKFSENQAAILCAALGLMSNEQSLREVASGTQTLDRFLSWSIPKVPIAEPAPELFTESPVPTVSAQEAPVSKKETEVPVGIELLQESVPVQESLAVVEAPMVSEPQAASAEAELPQTEEAVPVGPDAHADDAPKASEAQAPEYAESANPDEDLEALLNACFAGDGAVEGASFSGSVSETETSEDERLVELAAADVPPAPTSIRLSAF
ncbi:DUF3150 domain-containing protein [Sutterella sp.]|uniref:DUF3150 domain-containing protein n=1 Tax=Sutterella sp. TaxID=1981025 RepID=UPI003FD823B6